MFYKILTFYFFYFSPINFIFKKIILFRRIIFIFLYLQNVNSKYKFWFKNLHPKVYFGALFPCAPMLNYAIFPCAPVPNYAIFPKNILFWVIKINPKILFLCLWFPHWAQWVILYFFAILKIAFYFYVVCCAPRLWFLSAHQDLLFFLLFHFFLLFYYFFHNPFKFPFY